MMDVTDGELLGALRMVMDADRELSDAMRAVVWLIRGHGREKAAGWLAQDVERLGRGWIAEYAMYVTDWPGVELGPVVPAPVVPTLRYRTFRAAVMYSMIKAERPWRSYEAVAILATGWDDEDVAAGVLDCKYARVHTGKDVENAYRRMHELFPNNPRWVWERADRTR